MRVWVFKQGRSHTSSAEQDTLPLGNQPTQSGARETRAAWSAGQAGAPCPRAKATPDITVLLYLVLQCEITLEWLQCEIALEWHFEKLIEFSFPCSLCPFCQPISACAQLRKDGVWQRIRKSTGLFQNLALEFTSTRALGFALLEAGRAWLIQYFS